MIHDPTAVPDFPDGGASQVATGRVGYEGVDRFTVEIIRYSDGCVVWAQKPGDALPIPASGGALPDDYAQAIAESIAWAYGSGYEAGRRNGDAVRGALSAVELPRRIAR